MKQMPGYRILLVFLVNLLPYAHAQNAGITCASNRLKDMAGQLELPGINSLPPGVYDSYTYRSKPLTVRINPWREIEHIGFRLFKNDSIRLVNPSPVYDFLERYLLELQLPADLDPAIRLFADNVHIDGNVDDLFSFDGTETFHESYLHSKSYRISWSREEEKPLLSITFDMDFQLLSGCNLLELENRLLRDIRRYKPHSEKREAAVSIKNDFQALTDSYVDRGEAYLIDLIRNDLYYVREGDAYVLVHDEQKTNQSIANMMLSPQASGDFDLNLIFDRYGYKEEKTGIKLKQWINYCLSEGCTAFFGVKSKDKTSLKGTVFMVNTKKGYNHILSVEVPFGIIGKQEGSIDARLYAYIPMHNVSGNYFQLK
ncbi:MAG: hypothetical protein LBJ60_07315 [Tannerellaceae bacterium]|jgi:hypothetical protein|nr:hypothetical protein [Tannerellaceae bacterium]